MRRMENDLLFFHELIGTCSVEKDSKIYTISPKFGKGTMQSFEVMPGAEIVYQDALARKRNREVYFSELPIEVLEQFAVRDTYFTDSRTFEVIGHSVCIDDETLAEAISALPVERRDIILLSYFLDMSDAEIANVLNMVRRSVAYRRTSTLKLLKKLMGGENR